MKKISLAILLLAIAFNGFSQIRAKTLARPTAQPVLLRKNNDPVFLSMHNSHYINSSYLTKNPNMIHKMVEYSKVYTYPDKSSLRINLMKSPKFAGSTTFSPKASPAPGNGQCNVPGYNCTSNQVSVTATSSDFMNNNYAAQAAHIYPGAIYTYDHLYDGSFKEETGARNPIIIGTDNKNITGLTYDSVNTPTQNTISTAIAQLYGRFTGPAANGSTAYQIYESSNSADLNIKIGAGGSGYGFSFDNVFNTDHKEQHMYLTIDVRKTLFTVYVNRPDNGYFKTAPPEGSPLAVIGSVSYGVRILANLEITLKSQSDMDALSASYTGYGVNANADLSVYSSNSSVNNTINAYIVGGASNDATISFDKSQLEQQVQSVLQNANYQNAQPISYELFDLDGNVIGGQSITDQFVTCVCVPSNENTPIQSAYAKISTDYNPGDNKDGDTHYSFGLFDQNGNSVASYNNNSDNDEYKEGSDNTVQMKIVNVQASRTDFANGGHVHINVAPNGHDTWNIANFALSLQFLNDSKIESISWTSINLSQDRRDVDLYFDGSFHAR